MGDGAGFNAYSLFVLPYYNCDGGSERLNLSDKVHKVSKNVTEWCTFAGPPNFMMLVNMVHLWGS